MEAIKHTLPFGLGDMSPYMSEVTLYLHFNKHHQGYVNNYNAYIKQNPDLQGKSLHDVLKLLESEIKSGNHARIKIFENGAQAWNHDFFWKSLAKNKPSDPWINRTDFIGLGMSHFGSGWLWAVKLKDGSVDLCTTSNEDSPLFSLNEYKTFYKRADLSTTQPLLVYDLWEHGYYVDYQNRRRDYLENVFDNLINWKAK